MQEGITTSRLQTIGQASAPLSAAIQDVRVNHRGREAPGPCECRTHLRVGGWRRNVERCGSWPS